MKIIEGLQKEQFNLSSIALTIGNFDGVHLGHLALLKKLKALAEKTRSQSTIITFKNHPLSFLNPLFNLQLLTSLEKKLDIFAKFAIDQVILLEFNQLFSQQTAAIFLKNLLQFIRVHTLLLGYDAKIGYDRLNNSLEFFNLAKKLGFALHFLEPILEQNEIISSSLIREKINQGNLEAAEKLLGRKYSLINKVKKGLFRAKELGFPTANLETQGFCVPPKGVYIITAKTSFGIYQGIANLGYAPTIKKALYPLLEAHLFDFNQELYGKEIEIIFEKFLRLEKKFTSIENLKQQITQDIIHAKKYFNLAPFSNF